MNAERDPQSSAVLAAAIEVHRSFGSLLIELKAQAGLTEIDEAQVTSYLRATEIEKALHLNFGTMKLQIKRLVVSAAYRHSVGCPSASSASSASSVPSAVLSEGSD